MKTIFYKIFFLFILIASASLAYGEGAIKNIPGAQTVLPGKVSDVPEFVKFNEASAVSMNEFRMWASVNFGLSTDFQFELINSTPDKLGMVHHRYRQTFNGIPVEGAMFLLHTKNEKIVSMNGKIFNSISASKAPVLNEQVALTAALADINANVYKWQVPGEDNQLKQLMRDASASYFPKGQLVYAAPYGKFNSENLRLAWKFDVYAAQPESRNYVFVDALTGEVFLKKERIHTSDSQGTAVTAYSGTQPIVTDSTGTNYRLRETGRGNGIQTLNLLNGTNYANAVDFTDADNYWNNVNANLDQYATDAHWGAEMTYDYYWIEHNRNSIDDNGFLLYSYVHYSTNYANASWDGTAMRYGDGNGTYDPFTAIDITGHEMTHGVTEYSSNLDYAYESGALNESFSDIFGACVEFRSVPAANADWLMGEDIGAALRNMANPNSMGDPDTYLGTNWYTGTADNGGVHTNSNVQNFWFYLLTVGGNGTNDIGNPYSVTGIGRADAEDIAYRTNCFYLTNTSDYADARFYSIQAAIDLFGACTQEVISTTNAWHAVGVGNVFSFTVSAGFSANQTTSCTVPFTVNFTNLSTNAGTFIWNFGDNTTSNAVNPSHTYSNYGTYTVSLIADGGNCGSDSVIQTALINLPDMSPVATGVTVCKWDTPTLSATGTPNFNWYTTATGGNPVGTGSTFTAPPVTSNTNFYVESSIAGPSGYVGPLNGSIGTGLYHVATTSRYLIFDVFQPCTLLTAWVDAGSAANRTFTLLDNANNIINTYTVNIPAGQSTVTLNIPLTVGTGFRISATNVNLWRNETGVSFPYTINGLISITGSTYAGYYYYLYNWQVSTPACITERTTVPVTVALLNESNFSFTNTNYTYTFTDQSTTATSWYWNFGDATTSTQQNPSHTYAGNGTYVVMHVVSDGQCSDTTIQSVVVVDVGVSELSGMNTVIYPSPADAELRIKNKESGIDEVNIFDMLGKKVLSQPQTSNLKPETTIDVSSLAPGVYCIEVIAEGRKGTGRFVKR